MSISAISSSAAWAASGSSATNNPFAQTAQAFQALGSALSSGNLGAAQGAFADLLQTQRSVPAQPSTVVTLSGASTAGQAGSVGAELSTLGSDLQTGNLSGAQSAYQQIQSQLASSQPSTTQHTGGHHHGGHGGIGASSSASSSGSTSGTTSGSLLQTLLSSTASSGAASGSLTSGSISTVQAALNPLIQRIQATPSAGGTTSGTAGSQLNLTA